MSIRAAHNALGFSWQQTMLRIKNPLISIPFYVNNFGFKLIHKYDFPQWNFSLYFLGTFPENETLPTPGTPEAEEFLWTMKGTCLELTHNYGSETDDNFQVNNGNVEPNRGFGHIAVMTLDVYAASAELEAAGVRFQKKPDEGRMKGLAFALDPDGYWVEIVSRHADSTVTNKYTFAQTMIRVRDPVKSLNFYQNILGMTLIRETHLGVGTDWAFSLYFLAHMPNEEAAQLPPADSPDAGDAIRHMFRPVLELTHNHGTETDDLFKYHNGNDTNAGQLQGFGHIGFLVDDLSTACVEMEQRGVAFKKKPNDGNMHEIAFAYDPDGYWVEIIQRDGFRLTRDAASA